MKIITEQITIKTKGNNDIIDITNLIEEKLKETKLNEGFINIFIAGSTAGITTVEYESGLIKDLNDLFEKIAPSSKNYAHNFRWHDGNGHSHLLRLILQCLLKIMNYYLAPGSK